MQPGNLVLLLLTTLIKLFNTTQLHFAKLNLVWRSSHTACVGPWWLVINVVLCCVVLTVARLFAGVRDDGAPAAAPDQRPHQCQRPDAQVPLERLRGVSLCTQQLQTGRNILFQCTFQASLHKVGLLLFSLFKLFIPCLTFEVFMSLLQAMLVHVKKHAEEETELEP